MEKDVIVIRHKMEDPKGIVMPQNQKWLIIIKIADEIDCAVSILKVQGRYGMAAWRFLDLLAKDMGHFEEGQEAVVVRDQYSLIMKYPNKKKEDVRDLILSQLNELNSNAK